MTGSERITRGDLPHWYKPGYAHFVTYRLYNSIPKALLRRWKDDRIEQVDGSQISTHRRVTAHKLFYKRYDDYLDQRPNVAWLADPAVGEILRENLYYHHGSLYELIAWCIMPNHVHVVIQPFETALSVDSDAGSISHEIVMSDETADSSSPLSRIMHSLKSYTANRANAVLNRTGPFWQRESFDHWIRDIDELQRIVDYVRYNPVRAGLCLVPTDWRFSSAYDRYQLDGSDCALVGSLHDDWKRG